MSRNRKRASGGRRRIIKLKWKNRTIVERPCEVEEEGKNTVASEVHKAVMEVERRASEGAYSMGGKRDMNFQARLFPDEILVMAQRNRYFLQDS